MKPKVPAVRAGGKGQGKDILNDGIAKNKMYPAWAEVYPEYTGHWDIQTNYKSDEWLLHYCFKPEKDKILDDDPKVYGISKQDLLDSYEDVKMGKKESLRHKNVSPVNS